MSSRDSIILAVGSPPGRSLRGLVRASGPGALDVLDAIVTKGEVPSRGIARVRLRVPAPGIAALALRLPAPGSATGDDSFELLLPGNPHLLERVIDEILAIDSRARRAGPGEFSARAFLNGRITLDGAEGVAALIRASNDAELDAARRLASGAVARRTLEWSTRLAELCARLEAGIDFTDQEDVIAIEPVVLAQEVESVLEEIDRAHAPSDPADVRGHASGGGSARNRSWTPRVALVGPPNAGKSALFNALVGSRRTVASPTAGTTRDAIEVEVSLAGSPPLAVILVDLPGLDEGDDDALAPRLHAAARRAIAESDLILRCEPVDGAIGARLPGELERETIGRSALRVRTKADLLGGAASDQAFAAETSAHSGHGLDRLRRAIIESLASRTSALGGDAALLPRHRSALHVAHEHLTAALASARREPPRGPWRAAEEVAASLRLALDALGEITGATTSDDVLALVFSRFCIGK